MNYIIIQSNLADNYKGLAKRDGVELSWKSIRPIPVKSPVNKAVLPADILDDPDIVEAFAALDALPQENVTEIEFYEYDINGNIIN